MSEKTDDEPPPQANAGPKPIDVILAELGGDVKEVERVKRTYPMKATPYYLGLMKSKGDPIWKQCMPSAEELEDDYNAEDPLKEEEHTKVPYLVHKYPDRVLLLVSSKCVMYCRFCTRKRKVGRIQQIPMEDIIKAIGYIREHTEVRDVIVSGGDPLTRTDEELEIILKELRSIPHLEIIRIGTRMPCVQPSRITEKLAGIIKKYHPVYMNIHFNHPGEITEESAKACAILADAGIPLGSQTVLLKGVNDSPEVMMELMHKLLKIRVKPYYIFQCDRVRGTEHFRVPLEKGIDIMKHLQGFTSGLGVPHFIVDGPGGKIPISPQYVKGMCNGEVTLTNYRDEVYVYKDPEVKAEENGGLRVGLAFNLKRDAAQGEVHDKYAEFDDASTVNAIQKALEGAGHKVVRLEADSNFAEKVKGADVDLVFNIAEGLNGESRESHVPAILEMLKVPYTGSGVLTQAITLDKRRTKEILLHYSIPTPKYQIFRSAEEELADGLKFPLIVKPNCEGSSKGINNNSLVSDKESLKKQVEYVTKNYSQEALVEEYCTGREFTVALMGNGKPKVLPIVEITFDYLPTGVHGFDSYEVKWIYDNPKNPIDPLVCPANLTPGLKAQLEDIAIKTYKALGCVDFCRMDIRLDSNGIPHVLDVNALPGLIPDPKENSRFPRACFAAGMTYDGIVRSILDSAIKRYGIQD